jgi:hypothetical protein
MSASPGPEPSVPGPPGEDAVAALVAALDSAPAAVYFLTSAAEPVWANERARKLGTARSTLPLVAGRSIADVVDEVLSTGRSETICGVLGDRGGTATAILRPMRLAGGPGVLLVLETDAAESDRSLWPQPADLVEQAQLSLLPPSLPMLPDLRLSGSYHRASSSGAAGGDWYDAVPLGQGRVALVVGDAVGHGVPAAGAMSRLRGAMRSTALRDPSPRVVLAALDAFAAQMDDVEGASVFYGVLDAGSGTLTYGAAGHPPPLVVHADGRTSFLAGRPRPPLGSLPDATPRSPSTSSSRARRSCCSPTAPSPAAPPCPTTRWTGWPRSPVRCCGRPERSRRTRRPASRPRWPRACAVPRASRTTSPSSSRTAARPRSSPCSWTWSRRPRCCRGCAAGSAAG